MINEWGNPNAEFVILGTDPTAPNSDPMGNMKYPFNLPEYEDIENGMGSIRTRYFYPIYDNIVAALKYESGENRADITEFIRSNFLILNAIDTQVKDGNGKLLETGRSVRTKGYEDNVWIETFRKEIDGRTPENILKDRIRNKTVFLTSSYLLYIFRLEKLQHGFKELDNACKETYITANIPNILRKDGNTYEADFYPLYRHREYRLANEKWEKYRVRIRNILSGYECG